MTRRDAHKAMPVAVGMSFRFLGEMTDRPLQVGLQYELISIYFPRMYKLETPSAILLDLNWGPNQLRMLTWLSTTHTHTHTHEQSY